MTDNREIWQNFCLVIRGQGTKLHTQNFYLSYLKGTSHLFCNVRKIFTCTFRASGFLAIICVEIFSLHQNVMRNITQCNDIISSQLPEPIHITFHLSSINRHLAQRVLTHYTCQNFQHNYRSLKRLYDDGFFSCRRTVLARWFLHDYIRAANRLVFATVVIRSISFSFSSWLNNHRKTSYVTNNGNNNTAKKQRKKVQNFHFSSPNKWLALIYYVPTKFFFCEHTRQLWWLGIYTIPIYDTVKSRQNQITTIKRVESWQEEMLHRKWKFCIPKSSIIGVSSEFFFLASLLRLKKYYILYFGVTTIYRLQFSLYIQ
jgi:hypothetical protein